jgi:hypothetical protein
MVWSNRKKCRSSTSNRSGPCVEFAAGAGCTDQSLILTRIVQMSGANANAGKRGVVERRKESVSEGQKAPRKKITWQ